MLILPYSTELRFIWNAYVTFIVIIMCLLIYFMQDKNHRSTYPILDKYCTSINTRATEPDAQDFLGNNTRVCKQILGDIHGLPDKTLVATLLKPLLTQYTDQQSQLILDS